jgi:hypothetical protein
VAYDTATHPITGEIGPKCPATPTVPDIDCRAELATGTWECMLPTGHQGWSGIENGIDLSTYNKHSWSQTGA